MFHVDALGAEPSKSTLQAEPQVPTRKGLKTAENRVEPRLASDPADALGRARNTQNLEQSLKFKEEWP